MTIDIEKRVENACHMFAAGWDRLPEYLEGLAQLEGVTCPVEWLTLLADNGANVDDVLPSGKCGNLYSQQLGSILDRSLSSPTIYQPDDDDRRLLALCELLECTPDELAEEGSGPYGYGTTYSYGRAEYAVMTESEADSAWDESLDSYLDECVICELPEMAQTYFDREAWKRDARHDGRGHCLSSYDGSEWDAREFVVFRTN